MTYHIIPNNDLKEHTPSADCFCQPVMSTSTPFPFFDHNAVDGREATERRTGKAREGKGWLLVKQSEPE